MEKMLNSGFGKTQSQTQEVSKNILSIRNVKFCIFKFVDPKPSSLGSFNQLYPAII